jgi:hypothetical protein
LDPLLGFSLEEMLGDAPKTSDEPGVVLQPKVMTAGELEELKKEAQVLIG